MKFSDLVKAIKSSEPEALAGVPASAIAATLKSFFAVVKDEMSKDSEGVVTIPSFGHFKTKLVENKKEGAVKSVPRTLFIPAAARAAKDAE